MGVLCLILVLLCSALCFAIILMGKFVVFDSLHLSQQFFSYVATGLPGLNQLLSKY